MHRSFRVVVRVSSPDRRGQATPTRDVVVECTPTARGADLRRVLQQLVTGQTLGASRARMVDDDGLIGDDDGLIGDDVVLVDRLREGAEITVGVSGSASGVPGAERADQARSPSPVLSRIVVVGGLDAGAQHATGCHTVAIGRDKSCEMRIFDATVSARHALVSVRPDPLILCVSDQDSANGTFVNERRVTTSAEARPDDVVRVGAVEVEIQTAPENDRPIGLRASIPSGRGAGRERPIGTSSGIAFNRPPRTRSVRSITAVDPPKPPPPPVGRAPFRPAAFVIPLLFAGLLVAVTRQWMFAIFAAMSPVMMLANLVSDRRSNRDRSRRELARFRGELEAFDEQLGALSEQERRQRRKALPDLAEVQRRADLPSRSLWERRPNHDDFLQVRLGNGDPSWDPPLQSPIPPGNAAVAAVLGRHLRLHSTPIVADLRGGRVLGIAGPRSASEPLARALVAQVAVHHGPADVRIAFALDPDRARVWDWAKWLPHHGDASAAGAEGAVAVGSEAFDALAREPAGSDRTTVLVVDAAATTLHEAPGLRALLGDPNRPVAAIVLAASVDELPAACTTVVRITAADDSEAPPALARIEEPVSGRVIDDLLLNGITDRRARSIARSLTRFIDPDRVDVAATVPRDVSHLALLGLAAEARSSPRQPLAEWRGRELARRWAQRAPDASPSVSLGMAERGALSIDLVRDGPHALIGGTTGSGKSELLRSLVVGLAASCAPDQLTFVLIDYKGGSAFDACARLPHVVGMITDLDETLSARAVRCLEAELRWREQLLRCAGVSDRDSYVRRLVDPVDALPTMLPRLALVVDEFATLKSELPAFVDALVDVAQRGRSLGVHLVLATQRPAGTVSDLIRANTELKIALRVQDRADSNDVIGSPLAALLPRSRCGMAVVRVGSEEPVTIQAAFTGRPALDQPDRPIRMRPFRLVEPTRTAPAVSRDLGVGAPAVTELDVLVDAACRAAEILGCRPARRPWPEPLPDSVSLDAVREFAMDRPVDAFEAELDLGTGARSAGTGVDDVSAADTAVGIMDDPDHQCRLPLRWDRNRGNLLLVGASGSETGAALATIGAALGSISPSTVHLYAVHAGPSPVERLRDLRCCGDVIALSDRARVDRLLLELAAEVQRRQTMDDAERSALPDVVLLVDGLGPLRAEVDDPTVSNGSWDRMQRILADGPAVHVISALTIDRPALMTGPIGAIAEQRWIFRLADRIDYSLFGLRGSEVPTMSSMRCFVAAAGLVAQVADPPDAAALVTLDAFDAESAGGTGGERRPGRIRVLPSRVTTAELDPSATTFVSRPWRVALGTADATLSTAVVEFHAGEHMLVSGPARCGRTTVLEALVHTMHSPTAAGVAPRVACLTPTRSPLRERIARQLARGHVDDIVMLDASFDPSELARFLERPTEPGVPVVLLVDDAELVDDSTGVLAALAQSDRSDLLIVASVRTELLRASYGHWTRHLRRSRTAVLFRPTDGDAEFTGIIVPRRGVPSVPGRGFLARDGRLDVVQFAVPQSPDGNPLTHLRPRA